MAGSRFLVGGLVLAAAVAAGGAVAPSSAQPGHAQAHAAKRIQKAKWIPDGRVNAIAMSPKRIYIAGDFTHLRNRATGRTVVRNRVAAFRRDNGNLVTGFRPSADAAVDALAVLRGRLFLGGDFTSVNGADRQHLAAVSRKTGALTPVVAQTDGPVWALLSMKDAIYAGGNFLHVNGTLRTHLFSLDAHGTMAANWPDQTAGTTKGGVYALAATANQSAVVVGGAFSKLVGQPRLYIGEVSRTTGRTRPWQTAPLPNPGVCTMQCFTLSLAVDKSRIYAGVGGPGGAVAAYGKTDGATIWSHHTDGDVTAMAVHNHHLYIGGHFKHVYKHPRRQVAVLTTGRGLLTKRHFSSTGHVYPGVLAMLIDDGVLRLGGLFESIAGQQNYAIVKL